MTDTPRRLVRRNGDRMIAGVCSGLADYLDVDTTIVRLLTVVAALFSLGTALLVYVVMWALLPEADPIGRNW